MPWPAAPVAAAPLVLAASPRRDGVLGLLAALAFLVFTSKFHDKVNTDRAKQGAQGHLVFQTTLSILGTACSGREAFTVARLSLMLLLRTYGSVWVSRHWGLIVNSVVTQNFQRLTGLVSQFAGATVLLSLLNSLLKYYISLLKLEVREKITRWCHDAYMRPGGMIFYKANRVGEDKIEHCDHLIASDVERFSDSFAEVLSQSLKPTVDLLVYSVELSRVQGLATPLTLFSWYVAASYVCSLTFPPLGELVAVEQQLEGKFRSRHSELIANCEQIAFLGGERPEKEVLDCQFNQLLSHCRRTMDLSFDSEVVRQYLNKYFVTVIGLFLLARPLRLKKGRSGLGYSTDQLAQYFSSTWRNMEAMSSSIQSLLALTSRVGRLSGFAFRVHNLMNGLETRPEVLVDRVVDASQGPNPPSFRHGDALQLENVSIYKPDGALLLKNLSLTLEKGQRVLVTGDNGCGKSSLFRVIRRLWPLVEGTITAPPAQDIHFLTQVNFVPVGTLRDLVLYPLSRQEAEAAGGTDDQVLRCLSWAHVSPKRLSADGRAQLEFTDAGTVVRPSLGDVRDWQKDLSPGQKQRMAFARLFYHRPRLVVLDECTNGVSPDVEHDLYDRCAKLGLTVISISHKIELKLFHDYELHCHGDAEGSWTLSKCSEVRDKVVRASAVVKLIEPDKAGKTESRITYERHVWFAD